MGLSDIVETAEYVETFALDVATGIDGTVASAGRNLQVFFENVYNNSISGNLGMEFTLLGLGYVIGLAHFINESNKRRKLKKQDSMSYVIDQIAELPRHSRRIENSDDIQQAMQAIVDQLYGSKKFIVSVADDKDKTVTVNFDDSNKNRAVAAKLNPVESFVANWLYKNMVYRTLAKISMALMNYSFFYWIGWWTVSTIGGTAALTLASTTALGIGLSFGLPLILPVGVLAIQAVAHFYGKKKIEEAECQRVRRSAMRAYYAKHYYDSLEDQLRINLNMKGINYYALNEESVEVKQQLPAVAERQSSKSKRATMIAFATISGLILGFVFLYFAAWPVTAFITALVPALGVGTAVAIITQTTIALAAGFGVFTAIRKGIDASTKFKQNRNLIQEKKVVLRKFQSLQDKNTELQRQIEENVKTLRQSGEDITLKDVMPSISKLDKAENERFWRYLSPEKGKWQKTKKFMSRAIQAFYNSWTGPLLVRALFATAAASAFIFPPVSLTTFAILGVTMLFAYGAYKALEYHAEKANQRDMAFIDEAEARCYAAERENTILQKSLKSTELLLDRQQAAKVAANDGVKSSCKNTLSSAMVIDALEQANRQPARPKSPIKAFTDLFAQPKVDMPKKSAAIGIAYPKRQPQPHGTPPVQVSSGRGMFAHAMSCGSDVVSPIAVTSIASVEITV